MKYVNIGGCSVDTLIHVPYLPPIKDDMSLFATKTSVNIGGTGAGKALALDVLDAKADFITTVGNDDFKQPIQSFLNGLNLRIFQISVDYNTAHTNIMHGNGNRISIFTSHLKELPKVLPEVVDVFTESDVIFLNINEFCRDYIPYIAQSKAKVVVDVHDYDPPNPYHQDFINAADILVASGVNITDKRGFLTFHINNGKEVVILTMGSEGLLAMDKEFNLYELGGYNDFSYVDSNGAGDSFCVGFTMKFVETNNMLEALKFGTVCGGIACTSYDLFNRSYTRNMIEEIVKKVQL